MDVLSDAFHLSVKLDTEICAINQRKLFTNRALQVYKLETCQEKLLKFYSFKIE